MSPEDAGGVCNDVEVIRAASRVASFLLGEEDCHVRIRPQESVLE